MLQKRWKVIVNVFRGSLGVTCDHWYINHHIWKVKAPLCRVIGSIQRHITEKLPNLVKKKILVKKLTLYCRLGHICRMLWTVLCWTVLVNEYCRVPHEFIIDSKQGEKDVSIKDSSQQGQQVTTAKFGNFGGYSIKLQ